MNAEMNAILNRFQDICLAAYDADHNPDNSDTMYEMSELARTMAIDYLKSKGLWDCPADEEEWEWLDMNDPLWMRMDAFNDACYEDEDDEEEQEEDEEASTPSEDEQEKSEDPC